MSEENDTAAKVARAVFESVDAHPDKVQRIKLMGGRWPDHETDLGGLSERALASIIRRSLYPGTRL